MYLLMRDGHSECGGSGAVAWTGEEWSIEQCRAMRLESVTAWRNYCFDHGVRGDVWSAEIVVHEHIERLY